MQHPENRQRHNRHLGDGEGRDQRQRGPNQPFQNTLSLSRESDSLAGLMGRVAQMSGATEHLKPSKRIGVTERTKPDLTAELHRTLNNACRKWGAREIRLRYLPKPSLNRWISEALIDHHRVIEKIRADIPAGELTLQDMESFNDQPIARGVGDTQPTRRFSGR